MRRLDAGRARQDLYGWPKGGPRNDLRRGKQGTGASLEGNIRDPDPDFRIATEKGSKQPADRVAVNPSAQQGGLVPLREMVPVPALLPRR